MRILMLGDSITEGFDTTHFLPDFLVNNQGVWGDSTQECITHITADWFAEGRYDFIFLCIGTNDFARDRSDEEILSGIDRIANRLREHTQAGQLVFTSIFPTRHNRDRPNKRIDAFNEQLKELAEGRGEGYFQLNPHFTDDSGRLRLEYTDDGLHLTEQAYQQWAEVLKDYVSVLVND